MYSWWIDASGAADVSAGLGAVVDAGLIYAGQTGATKWPSGRVGTTTLRDRLGRNHLRGSISGSTFRRTLAACLFDILGLRLTARGRLARESEHELSSWMQRHLALAVYPFADRDALADLERRALVILDPVLNLEGMPLTPLRSQLSRRRRELARPSALVAPKTTSREQDASASRPPKHVSSAATTLHEEVVDILRAARTPLTTKQLAAAVNERGRYGKRDGSPVTAFQIHGRTRNYPKLFRRDGSTVWLREP